MKSRKEYRKDMTVANCPFLESLPIRIKHLDKNNEIMWYRKPTGLERIYYSHGYPILGKNEDTCQFTRYYFDGHGSKTDSHCPKICAKYIKQEFGITAELFKLLGSNPT